MLERCTLPIFTRQHASITDADGVGLPENETSLRICCQLLNDILGWGCINFFFIFLRLLVESGHTEYKLEFVVSKSIAVDDPHRHSNRGDRCKKKENRMFGFRIAKRSCNYLICEKSSKHFFQ